MKKMIKRKNEEGKTKKTRSDMKRRERRRI